MALEIASLVVHKRRPGSYGFVDSLEPLTVVWEEGGRKSRKWGEHGPYSEPEVCNVEDLEETCCPDCGEDQCWCGVGR